jgi:hypothetical protein
MRERIPDKLRAEVAELVGSQWWVRALLLTEDDQLGLILRAVMAKPTLNPPWLGPSAIIDQNGVVLRAWIATDARPETEQPEDRVPIEYRTTH